APGVYFSTQPADAKAWGAPPVSIYGANSASFTGVAAGATPTPTVSWEKGANGVYVSPADDVHISGSQTTILNISPTTIVDDADYIAVANSSGIFTTSSIAHLFIYSTNVDVTQPTDPITGFGDTSIIHGTATNAANAIDNSFIEWVSGGRGPNN